MTFHKALATIAALTIALIARSQVSFGNPELFNNGWKFSLDADSTSIVPEYDDSKWRSLDLPHDWSVEAVPSPTLASATGYLPGGIGWYRKHFTVNDNAAKHYVYFEGVYNRSEVYLNGHLLGKRPNGYISFMYDMTPYLKSGDNVLAVKVDHSRYADSRWYTGSGIYRDVYIVSAPETHIALWGVGYKAASISGKEAKIDVSVEIENPVKGMTLVARIVDAAGKTVAEASGNSGTGDNGLSLRIPRPHLWGLNDPYLYTLEVRLLRNGELADSMSTPMGLRTLKFDPDHGFALNGRFIKVKGVCLHHDAGVLGSVVPPQVWERRLRNLKAIGANAIRLSHNPQAPALYDLCDRLGLLVMDEASDEWEFPKRKWVEGWNVGTPSFDGTYDFFEEWIDRDVADMVRRDRNHPSVAFWSIGNEVDYPNDPYSHPVLDSVAINQPNFGGYDPKAPDATRIGRIAERLSAVVRSIDDSRPVTGALAGVVMSNQTSYPQSVDIVGYNYTEDRYDVDHRLYPDRVIYGSENGHGYDAWLAVRDNEHIFGQFLWTGTDYLGESGRWPSRGLGTGLLDFGSFPKARGKFRASLWLDEPVAYLGSYPVRGGRDRGLSIDAPAIWNYDSGQKVKVVCYTNAYSARLLLDGKEYAPTVLRDDRTGIIGWDVAFRPGTLSVEAMDSTGNVVAADTLVTTGRPYALRVTSDMDILSEDSPIAHVVVEVVDENGNMVPLADNMVSCRIKGGAEILGVEGTGNSDMTHPKAHQRRVSGGRMLVYVRRTGEAPAELSFTSPLLRAASLVIPCGTYVKVPGIIAHRGYWTAPGSAQNSRRSLAKADSIGCYGTEFDVWRTTDGVLFCNHDRKFKGVTLEESNSKVVRAIDLDNGENIPSLYSMLSEAANHPSLRLVFELKEHGDSAVEWKAIEEGVAMVREMGLADRTDYITFSKPALDAFVKFAPDGATVAYLTGDLTPAQVKARGANGIDYNIGTLRKHPEWIREAHDLGMTVNVWTVNKDEDLMWCIDNGVDYITTNRPEEALALVEKCCR